MRMVATGSVPAGTRVGRYEIVSLLRQGGMGEVYSAEDCHLHRRVALKILPKHRTSDPERVARFVREVRASATLNHPSIVAVHDAGSEGDVHFLAMELIDGVPLSEWMRKRRGLPARVELMAQVAEGLARAHDAGIVHRDLKPDNIMVTADGRAKIVDFGVAKLTERVGERAASTGITTPTSRVGTTAYMSPEQVEGKTLDRRTDVFSFGVVLYELLTGTNPFADAQYADTLHNVVHREPPVDAIPPSLRRVVLRCLRKDAALRYDSLRDAALDLREAITEVEPSAPVTRKRRGRWRVAIVILLLAGGVGLWRFVANRRAAATSEASGEPRGMSMTRLTNSGRVNTAAISPDGKYLVHVVREGDLEALYVKQIATGTITRIAEAAARVFSSLVVSPDGNYAYYVAADRDEPNVGTIYQLPLLGGVERRIAEDTEFRFSVSPDGTRVAFIRFNALTREMAMTTAAVDGSGERILLRRKQPESMSMPMWTHDGTAITFGAGNSETRKGGLYRYELATGAISEMKMPQFKGVNSYTWLPDGTGALVSVFDRLQPSQVWFVPAGATTGQKITSEVSGYYDVRPTADSLSFSAVREVVDSNIHLVTLDGKPRESRALTIGVGNLYGGNGVRWFGEKQVLFSAHIDGTNTYLLVDLEGGTPRRLIENLPMWNLTVSPDGSHVAFVSDKNGANDIWIADADGSNARQVTRHGNASSPSFTPDGRSIVYVRFGDSQNAWRISIDDHEPPVRITTVPTNRTVVSPDGKLLLCRLRSTTPGTALWRTAILRLDGKGEPRFFSLPKHGGSAMSQWHPNGKSFLYIDSVDGIDNLWEQELSGGSPRQITFFESGRIYSFDLLPDSKRLVVTRGASTSDAVLVREFR